MGSHAIDVNMSLDCGASCGLTLHPPPPPRARARTLALAPAPFYYTLAATDRFSWQMIQPDVGEFYYLEPQNVTTVHDKWGYWETDSVRPQSGRFVKWRLPNAPPPPLPPGNCTELSRAPHTDLPGNDCGELPGSSEQVCHAECCGDPACDAFVWVSKMLYPWGKCTMVNTSCCFKKSGSAGIKPAACPALKGDCLAVRLKRPPAPRNPYVGTAPASGIRSAVPLGGISTGSVELRGDGSFSEWTIMNQSPAGAAKIAEYPEAVLAVRLCGDVCSTKVLQTHPRGADGAVPGVDALKYSGAHPVSRLEPLDAGLAAAASGLKAELFAFSAMAPGDMEASARPAIAFSLA